MAGTFSRAGAAPVAATGTPGTVALPRRFTHYLVADGRVTGFKKVTIDAPTTARTAAPEVVRIETFSDPNGTKVLVRVLDGPLKDMLVSPDDDGVVFTPD